MKIDIKGSNIAAEVIEAMRVRYDKVPDLIFFRSVERAKSAGDLFDILESFPGQYPVAWDEISRRWSLVRKGVKDKCVKG